VHLLVKTIEFIKTSLIEKHEHARAERLVQPGQMLEEVVAEINSFIEPVALTANNVRRNTMKMLILCEFYGSPDQRIRGRFDIGIDEEDVLGGSERSTGIAADRGQTSGNHGDLQAITKSHHDFGGAVGRASISYQYFRIRHLRVILIRQRIQQLWNQFRLVLGWNHDGQVAPGIHESALPLRR